MTENQKRLFKAACEVQKNAYAPYSTAHLGSAVLMSNNQIYTGCNVENASYGGTVCAERVAIFKAISEGATKPILEIMVVSDATEPWPPCGFCRQILVEFSTPETLVHTCNIDGKLRSFTVSSLVPEAFTPLYLPASK